MNQTKAQIKLKLKVLEIAYKDNQKKLYKYAFSKTQRHSTSQDLVQETFLKTWKYLVKGGNVLIMKAFLYHVINDLIVDEYRKHKTLSLDSLIKKGFEPSVEGAESSFDILISGKKVIAMINCLPTKYKHVMHMKYVQELSLHEMALITGISKNTLAVQIHRGTVKLKLLYDE